MCLKAKNKERKEIKKPVRGAGQCTAGTGTPSSVCASTGWVGRVGAVRARGRGARLGRAQGTLFASQWLAAVAARGARRQAGLDLPSMASAVCVAARGQRARCCTDFHGEMRRFCVDVGTFMAAHLCCSCPPARTFGLPLLQARRASCRARSATSASSTNSHESGRKRKEERRKKEERKRKK